MAEKWYYLNNGHTAGPVDEGAFRELAAAGTVDGRTMVWHENLSDWVALEDSELVTALAVPADEAGPAAEIARTIRLHRIGLLVNWLAAAATLAGAALLVTALWCRWQDGFWTTGWWVSALCTCSGALAVWLVGYVLGLLQIYRAWKSLNQADVNVTPGQAVAGCVIPIFNFWWYFPAVVELAQSFNARLQREGVSGEVVNEGVCRCFAVSHALWLLVLPIPAAVISWCMIPGELKKGCVTLQQTLMRRRLSDHRKGVLAGKNINSEERTE